MSTIYSIALKLSLEGVNQLKDSFSIATQEIRKASSGISGIFSTSTKQLKELANTQIAQVVSIASIVGSITSAVKTGIEFEDTFLRATAKIKGGVEKDSAEFKQLEELVLDLGAKTEFSTTQAGQGLDFWAKAGKNTNEIMTLLPKTLDMATASGLDLARASDIISDAIGIFNLNSSDMNQLATNTDRIMDTMSKTVTMTNVNMEELFETSQIAGGIFTTAGQSIETFNSAVAILADNSMKSSVAGTNLRGIMARLSSPVEGAKETLEKLGVSIMDNKGNMRDFADIIDDLKLSTEKYGNAQKLAIYKTLVGQEAMNGLNFLVKEGGDKLRTYRKELELAKGSTKKLADLFRTDTKASLSNLTSAVEGLAIQLFKYLSPAINFVFNTLTNLMTLFNDVTKDSIILKGIFIGLGIAIIATFAPLQATIIGITLAFGGLVKAFQYCYKEFSWFQDGMNASAEFFKAVFFGITNTIKKFVDNAIGVFYSFSDGFANGFMNVLILIRQGIYTMLIAPIKLILTALSKLPSKMGDVGKAGLESLEQYEKEHFNYSFSTENKIKNAEKNQTKWNSTSTNNIMAIPNSNMISAIPNSMMSSSKIPTSKDVTPAVLETKFGSNNNIENDSNNGNSSNGNLSKNNSLANRQNNQNVMSGKSTLDININAPKNYDTSYSLNNFNNPLLINVNGNQ
ncbi:MAG TPA: phage tail tape measure protein [Rickettsiales bacterium]|nr:phage tail tape measure protein [Rickettsiales bacterium]